MTADETVYVLCSMQFGLLWPRSKIREQLWMSKLLYCPARNIQLFPLQHCSWVSTIARPPPTWPAILIVPSHAAEHHALLAHFLPNTPVLKASPYPEGSTSACVLVNLGWLQSSNRLPPCCNLSPRNCLSSSCSALQNPCFRRDLFHLWISQNKLSYLLTAHCHWSWPLRPGECRLTSWK